MNLWLLAHVAKFRNFEKSCGQVREKGLLPCWEWNQLKERTAEVKADPSQPVSIKNIEKRAAQSVHVAEDRSSIYAHKKDHCPTKVTVSPRKHQPPCTGKRKVSVKNPVRCPVMHHAFSVVVQALWNELPVKKFIFSLAV